MISPFGTVEGVDIFEVTLAGPDGMELRVITWGAVMRDLVVPTANGPRHVVLGLDTIEDYVKHSPYFGAVVGRFANRIGRARFVLDGILHELDANEGPNQLHGGSRGFGTRPWTIIEQKPSQLSLALVSEDGDMGYPGRVLATCTYSLLGSASGKPTLSIDLTATSDRRTPVNLTSHAYFNLDGSPDIRAHDLAIRGDFITPTHQDLIPTGAIEGVAGTPYDFRQRRPIAPPDSPSPMPLYDINYVLGGPYGDLAHAATLSSRRSGLSMELWTTEPGLQFYDGHLIDIPVRGLAGAQYRAHAGLCLEPQRFPDSPNKAHFPGTILSKGAVSRQTSEYRFGPATEPGGGLKG
jgi:aldose 1-epimerase